MTDWIPATDRLPDEGVIVQVAIQLEEGLYLTASGRWYRYYSLGGDSYVSWEVFGHPEYKDIAYWMPIAASPSPKRTNADVIRSMTDEQLRDFISDVEIGDYDMHFAVTFCDLCEKGGNALDLDCDGCILHWLQQDSQIASGLEG